jgi:hypothetical protein
VTRDELEQALATYAAGLEAELGLLRHLRRLADIQRAASQEPNFPSVHKLNDERERLMASLVKVEHEIRPLRLALHEEHRRAADLAGYDQVAALHRQASDLVANILSADRKTVEALRTAEVARRAASQAIELGETTLAAYRRVVAPELINASLVNKRG